MSRPKVLTRKGLALGIVGGGALALSGAVPLSEDTRRAVLWGSGVSAGGLLAWDVVSGRRSVRAGAILALALLLFLVGYFGGRDGWGSWLTRGGANDSGADTGADDPYQCPPGTPPGTLCLGLEY